MTTPTSPNGTQTDRDLERANIFQALTAGLLSSPATLAEAFRRFSLVPRGTALPRHRGIWRSTTPPPKRPS